MAGGKRIKEFKRQKALSDACGEEKPWDPKSVSGNGASAPDRVSVGRDSQVGPRDWARHSYVAKQNDLRDRRSSKRKEGAQVKD